MKKVLSILLALVMLTSSMSNILVFAADTSAGSKITVEDTYAFPGGTVDVEIILSNNPGIYNLLMSFEYDSSAMNLIAVSNGDAMSDATFMAPKNMASGCSASWYYIDEPDTYKDGSLVVLTFEVLETAETEESYSVSVTNVTAEKVDETECDISVESGKVSIIDYIPGDVNDDGRHTIRKDVSEFNQYIVDGCKYDPLGYAVQINENAGDVNDDNKINIRDVILINKYIVDGCTYDPNGYAVKLLPHTPRCQHTDLTAILAKEASCTEDGNIAYWSCECGKYFGDASATNEIEREDTIVRAAHTPGDEATCTQAQTCTKCGAVLAVANGHTEVSVPGYAATLEKEGLTDGIKCSVCDEWVVKQEVINKLLPAQHSITYIIDAGDYIDQGDAYLQAQTITNPNPKTFSENELVELQKLSTPGYTFDGWIDQSGTRWDVIPAGTNKNLVLYAKWTQNIYTVQYKSSLFVERAQDTYTVDTGLVLPTPRLSNYSFVGWSGEDGKLLTEATIPVGTTENLILDANWTSERNKTWTKPVLDDPIIEIDEENGIILFAYEIGEVQNVPLYTIKNFGYISGDGITKTESTSYQTIITDTMMTAYAKSVAKATTESSNWTLSNSWNASTSVNEDWCIENEKNVEEANEIAKSDSQNWNVSNSKSGSTETVSTTTNQEGWKNEVKINTGSSSTDSESTSNKTTSDEAWNVDAKLTYTPKSYSFGIDIFEVGGLNASTSGGWGGEIGGGYEHKWGEEKTETEEHSDTTSSGFEMGGTHDKSSLTTSGTTSTSSWNNTSSYGGSSTNSTVDTYSTALSEKISKAYGYGSSYATGGEAGSSQGLSSSQTDSESYSSSVTYSTETSEKVTSEWTTQATKPGYHRWVVAGTAHVFAVVGYNISEKSYFVYTYSVMDDETHEFEDYSYTSSAYNDHENGVISFEIPYEVAEYVSEKTSYSDGLKVNQNTGIIEGYTGEDTCVVIPEYWNVGNGDVVKVTGFTKDAFKGNENICAVVLSDFITEIPDEAFLGCTSLKEIVGGNVVSIGSFAFDGCTSVEDLGVRSSVEHIGEKAFRGVRRIIVNAADENILIAATESGAEQIIVSLEYLHNGVEALDGIELTVPEGTKFFEINGDQKTYENFSLVSNAEITVINKLHFVNTSKIPVTISSPEVILNQSSITSDGIGLVLSADDTHLGMQGEITIYSANQNAMLAKNLNLYEINNNVVGKLIIKDKLLQCGTTSEAELLSYEDYEAIDSTTFENLQKSFKVTFNAGEGTVSTTSKTVKFGEKYGELPTPTRDNYTFIGWYTEVDGGTEITADTVVDALVNQTLYAKWTPKTFTVTYDANGGSVSPESNTLTFGDTFGSLPTPTRDHYWFDGWYTESDGGDKITSDTEIDTAEDITVYAHWNLKDTSDWVKASDVPAGAQVVSRKYSYTLTEYTTSSSSSLSGWSNYDTKRTDWSETHGPVYSDPSNGVRNVWDESYISSYAQKTQYRYSRYLNYAGSQGKNYNNGARCYPISSGYCTYGPYYTDWMDTPYKTNGSSALSNSGYSYGTATANYDSLGLEWYNQETRSVDDTTRPNYGTRWYYQEPVYTYYFYKTSDLESESYPSGTNISNIQEWIRYREK